MTKHNRPGLPSLAYRLGGHAEFKQALLRGLADAARPALQRLTTRDDGDFAIALLDAWAAAADVFTFYQERIVQESFLRTATEPLSLAELARLIGYQPSSGVAAATPLAFTVDEAVGAPPIVDVPAGLKVQSIPGPGEQPQVFETLEPAALRAAWNRVPAALTGPPAPRRHTLHLEGVHDLAPGSLLLLRDTRDDRIFTVVRLTAVTFDAAATHATWHGLGPDLPPAPHLQVLAPQALFPVTILTDDGETTLEYPNVQDHMPGPDDTFLVVADHLAQRLRVANLSLNGPDAPLRVALRGLGSNLGVFTADEHGRQGVATFRFTELALAGPPDLDRAPLRLDGLRTGLEPGDVLLVASAADPTHWRLVPVAALATDGQTTLVTPGRTLPAWQLPIAGPLTVHALRARAALFGHNAPDPRLLGLAPDPVPKPPNTPPSPVELNGNTLVWRNFGLEHASLDLGAIHPRVLPGQPLFVVDGDEVAAFVVDRTELAALADFGVQARVTRVRPQPGGMWFADFARTTAEVLGVPEPLALADEPLPATIAGAVLPLLGAHPLPRGRLLLIEGDLADGTGRAVAQATVVAAEIAGARTTLELTPPLARPLRRATVVVRANVIRAGHGETVDEILGDGDARQVYQRFTLRQSPLTHVRAAVAAGRVAALELRVAGLRWREVHNLQDAGPTDHVYTLRTDAAGVTTVQFGDGLHGARLPSGAANVRAVYRRGGGLSGHVPSGSLRLLLTRPPGLRDVDNPLPASGAADPETLAEARRNVPRSVLTLGRVVTLQDYEDFAGAFPGIARALASAGGGDGTRRLVDPRDPNAAPRPDRRVVVHVAGPEGAPIDPGSDLHAHLLAALRALSDPHVDVALASPEPLAFRAQGRITVDPDAVAADVAAAVRAALAATFGFAARSFAQPVHRSEVVAAMQAVPGVLAVDLDALFIPGLHDPGLRTFLPARGPGDPAGPVQILTLDARDLEHDIGVTP